jgi:hypothetical protein
MNSGYFFNPHFADVVSVVFYGRISNRFEDLITVSVSVNFSADN